MKNEKTQLNGRIMRHYKKDITKFLLIVSISLRK